MITAIPLSEYGLETVDAAAARRCWPVRSVQKWIAAGLIRVVLAGRGRRRVFLLRIKDVDAFVPPPRGPKPGNQNARKKPAAKKPKRGK